MNDVRICGKGQSPTPHRSLPAVYTSAPLSKGEMLSVFVIFVWFGVLRLFFCRFLSLRFASWNNFRE